MPPRQPSLFDDLDQPPVTNRALLQIAPGARPLSKNQRLFDQLTERLNKLRAELQAWQAALARHSQRSLLEVEPLRKELLGEQRAAVLWLDALLRSSAERLSRRRRAKLERLIEFIAEVVLEAGPDDEVEAAFGRYSDLDAQALRDAEMEMAESFVSELLGEDFVRGHQAKNLDELLEHAGERLRSKQQQAEQQGGEAPPLRGNRRQRAAQERKAQAAREASLSVRELFRRLAAALHPDRETDPAERERKTALMQRVNQAYERNDLIELLTVQTQIEQIDAGHLAQATEQKLMHYCSVLREQQRALEAEIHECLAPLLAAFGPSTGSLRPADLDRRIEVDLREVREALQAIRSDMAALRDPARRAAAIDAIELDDGDDELPAELEAALLVAAMQQAAPRRRKRRRK